MVNNKKKEKIPQNGYDFIIKVRDLIFSIHKVNAVPYFSIKIKSNIKSVISKLLK